MMSGTDRTEKAWKNRLTSEQYRVLREKGTEPPFSGKFVKFDGRGTFTCAACGKLTAATALAVRAGSSAEALPAGARLPAGTGAASPR